jgi:exosortase/archaeosortase family protein
VLIGLVPFWQNTVLAWFTTDADVGNYKAAMNFAVLMTVMAIPVTTALMPAFSKLDQSAKDKIRTLYRLANKYISLLIVPATALVVIFSSEAVHIIYGSTFLSASSILAIHCLVYFLTGIGYLALNCLFNGLGETKMTLYMSAVIFGILCVTSIPLTSIYGVQGMIISFLVSNIAGTIFGLVIAKKRFQINYDISSLAKIYISAGASAVPALLLLRFASLSEIVVLIVGVATYIFIYLTLIPLTRAVPESELQQAMRITQKTPILSLVAKPVFKYEEKILHLTRETGVTAMKAVFIVVAAVVVFSQDLHLIFTDAFESEATSYIIAIPFILIYLIYRKRKMINAAFASESSSIVGSIKVDEVVGALLLLISFLLYWFGSYTFTPLEYHMLAMPIFVGGCILVLFNVQTLRQVIFPVLLLLLLVPPPIEILYYLGANLSTLSAELAYYGARLFLPVSIGVDGGLPAIFVNKLGQSTAYQVDVACSGIYSQIGFLVFALFVAYIIRDKPWKKVLIFAIGLPLIYLLNVLRIILLLAIGYYWGNTLALSLFHSSGGLFLVFVGTILLLSATEKLFKLKIFADQKTACLECKEITKGRDFCLSCGTIYRIRPRKVGRRDVVKVSALMISIFLILSIQAPVFALTKEPAELDLQTLRGEQASTRLLPTIPGYSLRFMYPDPTFENKSGQDTSLIYAYFRENETQSILYVGVEIASSRAQLHRWETCLVTWPLSHGDQPKVSQVELKDIQLLPNPPIIGRFFVFQHFAPNNTQDALSDYDYNETVLYWYETSVFKINNASRMENVKISLIVYPTNLKNLADIENQLVLVADAIATYWQPIKTWSQVALAISRNDNRLMALSSVVFILTIAYYGLKRKKKRNQNTVLFKKLSESDQQLIWSVEQSEIKTLPTFENISKTYENLRTEKTSKDDLLQRLSVMEKIGMVKSSYANKQDTPVHIWRATF